ncbi:MAG: cellulase family glycosylhydrolase [Sedimentisphaerales bacterium]|nr:cellulase family glycosylhydrolase [Sedimentisphaerales bacterium]
MADNLSRRQFLHTTAAAALAGLGTGQDAQALAEPAAAPQSKPAQSVFPRWRGFNLLYLFTADRYSRPVEDDFRWASDWGFNFIRLPMSYRIWTDPGDVYKIQEQPFERIDQVVAWGRTYGLHVSLNLHRGPGYCVNRGETEPFDLWKDAAALKAFAYHWEHFARRYKGISPQQLSFDLINEPKNPSEDGMTRQDYERVVRATVQAIRAIDPERLIVADGVSWGTEPMPELADLKIGQSCRGYYPSAISHYRASWVDRDMSFPEPIWPDPQGTSHQKTRQSLEAHYAPWAALARQGVGVHCGECGCFNRTPHPVFLAWFRDVLEILTGHNIGYALWELRGSFGVVNSRRADVEYADFQGQKLDKKLLDLLREF